MAAMQASFPKMICFTEPNNSHSIMFYLHIYFVKIHNDSVFSSVINYFLNCQVTLPKLDPDLFKLH